MLFLFAQPVLADAAMLAPECEMVAVSGSVPSTGQQGVPLDVQPAALFVGACDGPSTWTLELVLDDAVVASQTLDFDYNSTQSHMRMSLDEDLQPDAAYELRILPGQEGWGEAVVITFETGDQLAAGIEPPSIQAVDALAHEGEDLFIQAWMQVQPGDDPDDASILVVEDDFGTVRAVRAVDDALLQWQGERADLEEVCFTVWQEDARGDAVESAPFCATPDLAPEPEDPRGCGGREGSAMGLLLLGGLLARRSRS